jgi:hypothetical protein
MTTNQPDNRPIRPVFVLILNGAVIVILVTGNTGERQAPRVPFTYRMRLRED